MKKGTIQQFYIIGLSDHHLDSIPNEIQTIINGSAIFSGGKRHYELVKRFLPTNHKWLEITIPLDKVFIDYSLYDKIVVFASGDPLFYGIGNTICREFTNAEVKIYPTLNSLQTLSHRLLIPYGDMHIVTLTGRPWHEFDRSLIERNKKIGLLTDKKHTPAAIAQRMLNYGYSGYKMSIGENLGNTDKELVRTLSIDEASNIVASTPNCIILEMLGVPRKRPFGIADSEFEHLDGRHKMITKMSIRLSSLSYLDLHNRENLWDIGFCTGSVSIEAKIQFPHLHITSFEIREECERIMQNNCKKFGAIGIKTVIGDFLKQDLSIYSIPDAVFIGGHGGKLEEIVSKVAPLLPSEGVIVFNSVSQESQELFLKSIKSVGMVLQESSEIKVDMYNPILIMKAIKYIP